MARDRLYKIYVDETVPTYGGNTYFCEEVGEHEQVDIFYIKDNLHGSFTLTDAVIEIIQTYEKV